jgi:hypothetical protein
MDWTFERRKIALLSLTPGEAIADRQNCSSPMT